MRLSRDEIDVKKKKRFNFTNFFIPEMSLLHNIPLFFFTFLLGGCMGWHFQSYFCVVCAFFHVKRCPSILILMWTFISLTKTHFLSYKESLFKISPNYNLNSVLLSRFIFYFIKLTHFFISTVVLNHHSSI